MLRKDEIKVRAYNVNHLRRQIHGRKDCTIFIPYSCSNEIEKMDHRAKLVVAVDAYSYRGGKYGKRIN